MKAGILAFILAVMLTFSGCGHEPAISQSQARLISLNHAGVCIADVDYIACELEREGIIMRYEVDFSMNDVQYEYSVNARSGKIISFEIHKD